MFVQKTNFIGRGYISVKNRKKKTLIADITFALIMHLCPEKGTEGNLQQKNETNKTKKHLPEYSKIPVLSLFIYQTGAESGGQLDCQVEGSGQSEKMGEQRLHEIQQKQGPAPGVKCPHAEVHTGL